jgi:hypothetical protein
LAVAVDKCLRISGGSLEPSGGPASEEMAVIAAGPGGAVIRYPGDFLDWDDLSQRLSIELGRPVFSFHIHDGDLWMYRLFVAGNETTRFNPLPDYWGEASERELAEWRGDAAEVARNVPGLKPDDIECYLTRWDLTGAADRKAYADDEFAIGQDWQMVDFMKRIGLPFPDDGEPDGAYVMRWANQESGAPTAQPRMVRKWWKFW